MTQARLLLVELLGEDKFRHYRNELYPFFKGFARQRGVPVEWVRLGIGPDDYGENKFLINPGSEDLNKLSDFVKRFAPSHIIFNEKLVNTAAARLELETGAYWTNSNNSDLNPKDLYFTPALISLLGLKTGQGASDSPHLMDQALPDYEYQPMNELAREQDSFIKVLCGSECLYRRRLSKNPYFAGVALSRAVQDDGCSFCGVHEEWYPVSEGTLMSHALRQVAIAARTHDREGRPNQYLITGSPIFFKIKTFFERILEMNIKGSAFFFSCRIDEFLRRAKDITELLPRLQAKGHSINLYNMGVENFSAVENERFNKGITLKQVEKASAILKKLEKAHPENFSFIEFGGLAFILFTPWTSLSDLEINLEAALKMGIAEQSYFLRSRLQLLPQRPITLLAEQENLLIENFEDMEFDSGCITSWDEEERPWRFRHPEVALAHRIISRLNMQEGDGEESSPEFQQISEWRASLPPEMHLYNTARALCEVLRENPSIKSLPRALELTAAHLPEMAAEGRTLKPAAPWSISPMRTMELIKTAQAEAPWKAVVARARTGLDLSREDMAEFFKVFPEAPAFHCPDIHHGLTLKGEPINLEGGGFGLVLRGADEEIRLTLTPAECIGEASERLRIYQLRCRLIPRGGTPVQRRLSRRLASLFDLRSFHHQGRLKERTALSEAREGRISLFEEALYPQGGGALLFAGFKAFWPVLKGDGKILLSLVKPPERVDLYIEPRREKHRHFTSSDRYAISYFPTGPIDSASKQRAVLALGRRLRNIESKHPISRSTE